MEKNVRILILEDSGDDAALIERELRKANVNFLSCVVNQKQEMELALREFKPDVVISDHAMPSFNSIEALKLCKEYECERNVLVPFILVTGTVSEEFAVMCIKSGADDYVLKDRLKRLPNSIQSAIERARYEAERQSFLIELINTQTLMKETEHLARLGSMQKDLVTGRMLWSDEMFRLFGHEPGAFEPALEEFFQMLHPDDRNRVGHRSGSCWNSGSPRVRSFELSTRAAMKNTSIPGSLSNGPRTDRHGVFTDL